MDTIATLLNRIEAYCRATSMTDREFGYASVQDGRLVERLRAGKGSVRVIQRVDAFLNAKPAKAAPRKRRASPPVPTQASAA